MSAAVGRRHYLRGRDALSRGDVAAAEDSLRAAVDLLPNLAPARIACADALVHLGDPARAASLLRAGLARGATETAEAALWAALGDALIRASELAAAEDAFLQAARHPRFAGRAAAGRARVLARLGRYRDAFSALATAARGERSRNGF